MAKKRKRIVVTADSVDNAALILALEAQGNAIPIAVSTVIRLAAPIIARIAIRYVARKYRKKISDTAVNTASAWIGKKIGDIIERASQEETKK